MNQLKPSDKQLLAIGFTKRKSKGDKLNKARIYYDIPTINGSFYYNPKEPVCVWYHRTNLGEHSTHVKLDITCFPTLFIILKTFGVKFNFTTY